MVARLKETERHADHEESEMMQVEEENEKVEHPLVEGKTERERERRWLPYRRAKDGASVRLFLFHWAGASASAFSHLDSLASEALEVCSVQMPGREDFHFDEYEGRSTITDLAKAFISDLKGYFTDGGKQSVFFGHGTGCWFAFEVARILESTRHVGFRPPVTMFVSCFPAPDIPVDARPWPTFSEMNESEFIREMCTVWRVPRIALKPPALSAFYGALRRDFNLLDDYMCAHEVPKPVMEHNNEDGVEEGEGRTRLQCPIGIFLSRDDPFVGTNKGEPVLMEAWGKVRKVA